MSQPLECTFDKNYLASATILYIESDAKAREEACEIFYGFFKRVFVASNLGEAIKLFMEHQLNIDVILSDIDMPDGTGVTILSEIRKINWEIPILVSSTFQNHQILLKAIKFNLNNYIVKPIQLNTTLKIVSDIMKKKEQKKALAAKNNELRQFMSILDSYNIICELDLDFNIKSVNDAYIINSGFEIDELIGKKYNDKMIFSNCESSDLEIRKLLSFGKSWVGLSKKITKDGNYYYTHSTILPIFKNNGDIKKYIEFSTLISKYENEILALKKHILLLKSENFKTNTELRKEKDYYEQLAKKLQAQVDENVNNSQKLLFELYEVKKRNNLLVEKLKIQERRFEEFQATIMSGQ